MPIYQPLNESEEKAIDALVLTLRVNCMQEHFKIAEKNQIKALEQQGFTEAAKFLKGIMEIPF